MKKIALLLLLFLSLNLFSQLNEKQIDALVEQVSHNFNVPGIAIAIVKDGKIVIAKGYGVRSIVTKEKVDANTLFGIASNTKAFTTAALSLLVDEKKLNWEDKVIKHLPTFKMYNDYVTQEFTIRDLVTHRSGLDLGAGDLMIWPDGSDFNTNDIIKSLQYLKPVSDFRSKFNYNNILYIVAGELIAKITGKSWCDFIEERMIKPLGMKNSAASFVRLKDTTNCIVPHVPLEGKLKIIPRYKNQIFDAAAGIYSNANDLSQWMIMQLQNGKYGNEKQFQLFSKNQQDEMWSLNTIIPTDTKPPYNTHFSGYGLGWFLSDVKGFKQVTHTGGLEGIVTQTTLIPELNLGIAVLTNQQSGAAFSAITNTIKNSYLGIPPIDYVDLYSQREKNYLVETNNSIAEIWITIANKLNEKRKINTQKYIGIYIDNWFGKIEIIEKKGRLFFKSFRSSQLEGEVFYYQENTFVVKWNKRYFNADAYLFFEMDKNEKISKLKMKPISDITDFSYDFQDLDFIKISQ